jgi:hypothetical protein
VVRSWFGSWRIGVDEVNIEHVEDLEGGGNDEPDGDLGMLAELDFLKCRLLRGKGDERTAVPSLTDQYEELERLVSGFPGTFDIDAALFAVECDDVDAFQESKEALLEKMKRLREG